MASLDPHAYPLLSEAIREAQVALGSASVGSDSDRLTILRDAEAELAETIKTLSAPAENFD